MKLSEILSERTRLWSQVKLADLDLWRRMSVDQETKVTRLEEKNAALKREIEKYRLLIIDCPECYGTLKTLHAKLTEKEALPAAEEPDDKNRAHEED